MKKKALKKEFYMEIRKSLGRFLSIFFIVAIGVAFFSGIRASEPDMRYSGDQYFDEKQLMDVQVISTLGLSENDVKALREVEGIEKVEAGYSVDALCMRKDSQVAVHIMSILPSMNELTVEKGRLPKNDQECVVDADFLAGSGYKIGDQLHFTSGNGSEITDTLTTDTFTIVGTVSSPCYISFGRGSTNIGTGSISGFVSVLEDSFQMDVYTEVYATVAGAAELTAFTDAYSEQVKETITNIEAIREERQKARREEIVAEAEQEVEDGRKKLEDAKTEADEELADARKQLNDGWKQLCEGKEKIAASYTELENSQKKLESGQKELDANRASVAVQQAELQNKQSELNAGQAELDAQKVVLEENRQKLNQGQAELDEKKEPLNQAQALLDSSWIWLNGREQDTERRQKAVEVLDAEIAALEQEIEQLQNEYAELEQSEDPDKESKLQVLEQQIKEKAALIVEKQAEKQEHQLQIQINTEVILHRAEAETVLNRGQEELDKGWEQLKPYEEELQAGWDAFYEGEAKFNAAQEQLSAGQQQLNDGAAKLEAGVAQLDAAQEEIDSGWIQITQGREQLKAAETEIAANEQKLNDAQKEYNQGKADAEKKIADAESELKDAEDQIKKIENAKWYIYDRTHLNDYSGYGENADRMRAIGKVFPVLFFLVAALISLTTMTRMVEEQRTQIGTMKALGYDRFSIAGKYLGYAFLATVMGCILGVLFGEKVFPFIIIYAYGIMYEHMNSFVIPYNVQYALLASLAALACTILATVFSCYKELREQAAELMRPPTPKQGKRVLLERITFLWSCLSFTWKSTIRNLVRYKKRFFMTIFGIGGCMALLLVGFGLKDSIFDIGVLQYHELQLFDGNVILNSDATEVEQETAIRKLKKDSRVQHTAVNLLKQVEISNGETWKDVYLNVAEDTKEISDFMVFRDRITGTEYSLEKDSVILTEKMADELGVEAGDTIYIKDETNGEIPYQISAVCENYLQHYLYMTAEEYEKGYGEEPEYNSVYYSVKEGKEDQIKKVGEEVLKEEGALSVSYTSGFEAQLEEMLGSLNIVIVVLVISAGMLAFVVLYNLNNINITERKRELATLKVLGFYPMEVAEYVYRENIILTFIGGLVGILFGKILHRFIIVTVEIESTMFGRNIDISSFVYGFLITFGFSILVNAVMYFKLKKIDMVESLKSVE